MAFVLPIFSGFDIEPENRTEEKLVLSNNYSLDIKSKHEKAVSQQNQSFKSSVGKSLKFKIITGPDSTILLTKALYSQRKNIYQLNEKFIVGLLKINLKIRPQGAKEMEIRGTNNKNFL